MKIYKCIALVTLILGLALCVGGVLMNGLDQLPGEAQKVTNYVKFKSFGKAKDVNLELIRHPIGSSHTPPQLVHLRKSQTICIMDDHRIGIGNIQSGLNNRC